MNHPRYVLAGDVGGTNLRVAAVDFEGSILHLSETATPRDGLATDILAAIVRGAEVCVQASASPPLSFGLAVPALINSTFGRILSSPNLPQLNGLDLADRVGERLQLKVVIENDATAAAIGEHWLGSSKAVGNSVFVTLGTGVGGGLILNGKPFRGTDGTAGEIGHICVEPDGVSCGCGSRGCVEQYASARAIARTATELARAAGTARNYQTSKDVFDAATEGDAVAIDAFRSMGRYLGIALADLVNVLNPELIAIGGGAAGAWDYFIEHVRSEIRDRAFPHPADSVRLVRASLGESAGILGAARIAFD
jgi:glucokinase